VIVDDDDADGFRGAHFQRSIAPRNGLTCAEPSG
jgi:hypothetical protein